MPISANLAGSVPLGAHPGLSLVHLPTAIAGDVVRYAVRTADALRVLAADEALRRWRL